MVKLSAPEKNPKDKQHFFLFTIFQCHIDEESNIELMRIKLSQNNVGNCENRPESWKSQEEVKKAKLVTK